MPVSIRCPRCNKLVTLQKTTLGKKVKCQSCGYSFVAGGDEPEEPMEAAPEYAEEPAAEPEEEAPVEEPAARRRQPQGKKAASGQGLLRGLVLLIALVGVAAAGFVGAAWLQEARGTPVAEIEQARVTLQPMVQDYGIELATPAGRRGEVEAYLFLGAAALGLLGALLALSGRGVIPALILLAAMAAPIPLEQRRVALVTAPLGLAGLLCVLLRGPARGTQRRSSGVRFLAQLATGALAGALLAAGMYLRLNPELLNAAPPRLGAPVATPPVTAPPAPLVTKDTKPDFTLTVQELFDQSQDEAGRAKFEGKVVEVAGVVVACRPRDDGSAILFQIKGAGTKPAAGVPSELVESEAWARLAPGQKIKIRGIWDKGGVHHAIIVDADPNPAVLYSAEQLARDFETDPAAFLRQYKNKPLVVEGTVAHKEAKEPFLIVELKGSDRLNVTCRFPADGAKQVELLNIGGTARVFGELSGSNDKMPTLERCLRITSETTAQRPAPLQPPDPYKNVVRDPAGVQAMLGRVGNVKLAPVEFKLCGVDFTLQAPEGAKVVVDGNRARIEQQKFALTLEPGRTNLPAAEKFWAADRSVRTLEFVIVTEALVLRKVATTPPSYTFVEVMTLGPLDVHATPEASKRFELEECLLMIRCAGTLALKPGYRPPDSIDALKSLGLIVEQRNGKTAVTTPACFTDATMDAVVKLVPDIEELTIDSPITDRGFVPLFRLRKLRVLDVRGGRGDPYSIDGSGLAFIKRLRQLESLQLDGTGVSDASLATIASLTNLKRLSLEKTSVTDAGLEKLKPLSNLTSLNLKGTKVTPAGIEKLKKEMPKVKVIGN